MRNNNRHSLKSRLIYLGVLLSIGVTLLLGFQYVSSLRTIRQQTYHAMESAVSLYAEQTTETLHTVELYLLNYFNSGTDLDTIVKNQRDSTHWGRAVSRIEKKFLYDISIYPMDGFFLYVPGPNYIVSSSVQSELGVAEQLKKTLAAGETSGKQILDKWTLLPGGSSSIIYRILRVRGCYVGAWMDVSVYLNGFSVNVPGSTFSFSDSSGRLLGENSTMLGFHPEQTQGYSFIRLDNVEYMVISQATRFSDLYMAALVPRDNLESGTRGYFLASLALVSAIVLALVTSVILMGKWLSSPLKKLHRAIEELRAGNWESVAEEESGYAEFQEVNHAFNEMVSQVQVLKIDIYEEQLNRQQIEMDYLRLQVPPHFLINCLNAICQLCDADKPELAQRLAMELSGHLRYTLSAEPTVCLAQELEYVKNYVELSNIRYHGAIRLVLSCETGLEECTVIPLLLLNFVENAIKHQVVVGKVIEIHIDARRTDTAEPRLLLDIWDTGEGFSLEMLECLADTNAYIAENKNIHVGISNVIRRAEMLLGDCGFTFSNKEGAGAHIAINVPISLRGAEGAGSFSEYPDC